MTYTMSKKKKTPRKRPGNPWPATLKRLRVDLGLDQVQAAERVDAPLGTWRGWEQGRRVPSPMIVKLMRLAFPEFDFDKK